MSIFSGLATYEIYKTGFMVFIIYISFMLSSGCLFYNGFKNYQKIEGTITTNEKEKYQTLTYFIDKEYSHKIFYTINNNKSTNNNTSVNNNASANVNVSTNNSTVSSPQYTDGKYTVYYPKDKPEEYNLSYNPFYINIVITIIYLIIVIIGFMYFYFLRSNRDVAGVIGGLDVASDVGSFFK